MQNMSFTFWSFVFLSVVLVNGKKTTMTIPPQYAAEVFTTSVNCIKDTGVDPNILDQIIQWNFQESDKIKKFMYCMGSSLGYCDSDGHILTDKTEKLLNDTVDKEEFINVLKECNKQSGSDKYDTYYKAYKCNYEKQSTFFSL